MKIKTVATAAFGVVAATSILTLAAPSAQAQGMALQQIPGSSTGPECDGNPFGLCNPLMDEILPALFSGSSGG